MDNAVARKIVLIARYDILRIVVRDFTQRAEFALHHRSVRKKICDLNIHLFASLCANKVDFVLAAFSDADIVSARKHLEKDDILV